MCFLVFELVRVLLAERSSGSYDPELFLIMGHSVYILQSVSSGRYYVGSSEDPERRVQFHNSIEKGFTSRYRPWKIVYRCEFEDKELALQAERKVKKWKSRKMLERLIAGEISL